MSRKNGQKIVTSLLHTSKISLIIDFEVFQEPFCVLVGDRVFAVTSTASL